MKPWTFTNPISARAREFLKEYAIIVIGVLTALGAEQGVEAAHWHQKVAVVRSALQGGARQRSGPLED